MITLKNLTKIYTRKGTNDDVVALSDINLAFPEKGFVAILGASGSGKTTLLNIIGGLDKPTSGHMIVDGLSTAKFKGRDWDSYRNQKIGFVLQNCYLMPHLNVRDNVAVKLQIAKRKRKQIDELVDNALESVGLTDKKYDRPKALSGGQKQRVAIARALVGNPTVILADEPTGALDSKTGKSIMELLKELSKDHLVVMVTHNNDYASKYADRVIELQDGTVINDSSPISLGEETNAEELSRVSIPFKTSFKWGIKNLVVKKFSTISIVVASSLGLAGVGLILSISSGVKEAFGQAEANAFSQYPITINSYSRQSSEGSTGQYTKYTKEESVFVDYSNYAKQEHFNFMNQKFLTYMSEMPKTNYYVSYDSSVTSFSLFTEVKENTYRKISSTSNLFYKGLDDLRFLKDQYDCLTGKYPTEANELALVVDEYNRVNVSYLNTLGFDVDPNVITEKKFTFEDILNKTYRYITNDDYYRYDEATNRYVAKSISPQDFYNLSTAYELKITGILRQKRDNLNDLLRDGVMYTPAFERKVIEDANNSDIVTKQLHYGLEKDVTTGQPFADYQSGSTNISKEYQYEQRLYNLGQYERITTLYYFTTDYASRVNIKTYFSNYVKDTEVDFNTLSYNDYLERATMQFDGALTLMTTVLYVFAVISVIVSAILNGILTYISMHQRTNEIGLLRSLGSRKKDIGVMVETESILSGLIGGLLSVLICVCLIKPINVLVTKAIYEYKFYLLSSTTFELGGFRWWVAPIIIGLALITALISALIPSIIASRKDPAKAINE